MANSNRVHDKPIIFIFFWVGLFYHCALVDVLVYIPLSSQYCSFSLWDTLWNQFS